MVIPLGAASKEHGPHLKLKNDLILANDLKERVRQRADVVIAPTVPYSFYPAFVEYPGSTSLSLETSRDTIVEICRGLSRFGPKRFYVLNTGLSTVRALAPAAEMLAAEGILLRYTDLLKATAAVEKADRPPGGRHARRRDRDVDDPLHEPRRRRHEQSRQGLPPGQGRHSRATRRPRGRRTRPPASTATPRSRRKRRAESSPRRSSRPSSRRSRSCGRRGRRRRPHRLSRPLQFAKIRPVRA